MSSDASSRATRDQALAFLHGGGEMGARMREKDWASTPLGPPELWPQSLKTCVRIILTSRQPMFVWWGESLINLYNDAYKSIVGGKHPEAFGQPASLVWREIWDQVGPRAAQCMSGDEGTYDEALLLIMERHGYQEETYYTFSYSPVPHDASGTGGLICANSDDTRRIIGERQMALMRDLATRTADARKIETACALAAESLATNPRDLPFALVYLLDANRTQATLAGSTAIEPGHRAAPATVPFGAIAPWPFAEALEHPGTVHVVEDLSAFAPLPAGAWPKAPSKAALVPIPPSGPTGRAGILVVGLSSYRRFDDDYQAFLGMVAGQISASIGNAQAHEQEKQRAESLAELDRAKTLFFSNVSHEFRTPLTLMLGPTEDALRADPPVLAGESLRAVHRNELRLLKLVNALLEFSRIEAGRVHASYSEVDLGALTRDLSSAFRAAIERAGLAFVVDCTDVSGEVFVDRDMWEKIVLNLLSNALKFTFEGSIAVRLTQKEDTVELCVEDTGIGVAESELPHLFERFHRVEGVRARTQEGSGIGLALVSELVRLHQGRIDVKSRVGEGTRFTVALPLGSKHLPAEQLNAVRSGASTAIGARPYVEEALRWLPSNDDDVPSSFPPDGMAEFGTEVTEVHGARIVLVDDNADMRDYVTRLLRPRWTVEAFADGRAAFDAVRKDPPDLVLTDVMMPHLDGFGLLRALRSTDATSRVPVIMLSARAGAESRIEGLEAGADDYLVKPFSARELVARVSTHVQLARLREVAETERRKLEHLFAQAPVAIAVLRGDDLRFSVANERFREMIDRSEVVGRTIREVFPELGDHAAIESLDRVFHSGEQLRIHEMKVPLLRAGRPREGFFDYTVQPLLDPTSMRVNGIIVVAVEVTEQVLARQKVDGLRAAAEDASRAKDEFLSTLSHELRTPLNAIVGWSTLLRENDFPAERTAQALETIERNARVQARLIEDLLDLSRIEQGRLVLSVGPVEMVKVVEAAIETVRPACDAKGLRLQPVLDSHATIVGDPDRLQQIVWNLLSNAMKFTPKGGRIRVSLSRAQSHVELTVSDNGQGIDASFLPHVFDRFRQGDASISRRLGGLGLGLAIVRSLVELHGGTIVAHSDGPGEGANFTVRLPTAPIRSERANSPAASAPRRTTFECPASIEGLRVLVVDDEPETRELLRFVLEQCKASVTTAPHAADGFDALQAGTFDLLLSDIGMPGEDGYSFVRRIRELAPTANGAIPAIALTAYARGEDRTHAIRAGFDVHMSKPIDPSELMAVIDRLVSRHRR
jgi:signal transduction histidine kinase